MDGIFGIGGNPGGHATPDAAKLKLQALLRNDPMYHEAMATGNHQAYNAAVAKAMQQLRLEMARGGMYEQDFDPSAIFKAATGADLNSALHVSDTMAPSLRNNYQGGGFEFDQNPALAALRNSGYDDSNIFLQNQGETPQETAVQRRAKRGAADLNQPLDPFAQWGPSAKKFM